MTCLGGSPGSAGSRQGWVVFLLPLPTASEALIRQRADTQPRVVTLQAGRRCRQAGTGRQKQVGAGRSRQEQAGRSKEARKEQTGSNRSRQDQEGAGRSRQKQKGGTGMKAGAGRSRQEQAGRIKKEQAGRQEWAEEQAGAGSTALHPSQVGKCRHCPCSSLDITVAVTLHTRCSALELPHSLLGLRNFTSATCKSLLTTTNQHHREKCNSKLIPS